jgi:hypothetical protein
MDRVLIINAVVNFMLERRGAGVVDALRQQPRRFRAHQWWPMLRPARHGPGFRMRSGEELFVP